MKFVYETLMKIFALRQSAVLGFSLILLLGLGISAKADLVQNGNFESATLSSLGVTFVRPAPLAPLM
jgi:hypothetical protein